LIRPGLNRHKFRELFALCRCGLVTTRRTFRVHECLEKVITVPSSGVPVCDGPANRPPNDYELLMRLDALIRPGLTAKEFVKLFMECRCGLIMTQRVFGSHECLPEKEDIIDLTNDLND
jgi:hypothetical protein